MENVRTDIVMAVRFNAQVPDMYQNILEAKSGAVALPPLDLPL